MGRCLGWPGGQLPAAALRLGVAVTAEADAASIHGLVTALIGAVAAAGS